MLAELSVTAAMKAEAAPLTYSATFSLELVGESDVAGLDGALVTFTASFDDGARYQYSDLSTMVTASSHVRHVARRSELRTTNYFFPLCSTLGQ